MRNNQSYSPLEHHQARCPRCHHPLQTIAVHGHEQCAHCKANILECCSGETCEAVFDDDTAYLKR